MGTLAQTENGVLRNFVTFKGKHLHLLNVCNLIQKETLAKVFFAVSFGKFLRRPFFNKILLKQLPEVFYKKYVLKNFTGKYSQEKTCPGVSF